MLLKRVGGERERKKKLAVLNDADRVQVSLTRAGYFSTELAGLERYLGGTWGWIVIWVGFWGWISVGIRT